MNVIKARNKKLSLILVLAMVMTMFAGLGTASAATNYSAVMVPPVTADESITQDLGAILIEFDTLAKMEHQCVVTLPTDITLSTDAAVYGNIGIADDGGATFAGEDNSVGAIIGAVERLGDNELKINLDVTKGGTGVKLMLPLQGVKVADGASAGPIEAEIANLQGQFPNGKVTVANVVGGAVLVTAVDTPTISGAGTIGEKVQLTIREDSKGAIEKKDDTIKFKLPKGFTWKDGAYLKNVATGDVISEVRGTNPATKEFQIAKIDEGRTLTIDRKTTTLPRGMFRLYADVSVDEEDASFGDVVVSFSGATTAYPGSAVIGTYADFGYVVNVANPDKEIVAGRTGDDATISKFTIKENVAGSLLNGRTVYMTLPEGVQWNSEDVTTDITVSKKDGDLNFIVSDVANNPNKVKMVIQNTDSVKGKVEIEANLVVAVDYEGPITIQFSGSGGIDDTITVGNVVAPIKGSANVVDVKIGLQDQKAGDITITENVAEAIDSGKDIVLTLPAGVSWAKLPTVTADNGLTLGTVTRDENQGTRNNKLIIPIKGQSDKAANINISDVYYSVDRTVPAGDLKITVAGDALDKANIKNRKTAAVVKAANVVTPAPGDVANVAVFNYGETTYTLNGAPVQMDVAPYAKNNRTYVPVRYCANALGISDNNIIWNQQNKTVTMMKGDKVVQLKLGSNVMTINGVDIYMDVVVEAQNGRTFLPAAWVAQAFGAKAVWDPANPTTVTISY